MGTATRCLSFVCCRAARSRRERGGNPVPAVFHSERQAFAFIRSRIAKGGLWCTPMRPDHGDNLHERFEVKRINHQEASSLDGACTDQGEEYFSRLRRAEICIHPHIAGTYLLRYAQENYRGEDNRRVSHVFSPKTSTASVRGADEGRVVHLFPPRFATRCGSSLEARTAAARP